MAKKIYTSKENVQVQIVKPVKIKVVGGQIEIQITPLSVIEFCNQKKIFGLNRSFLEKKYVSKEYDMQVWLKILLKEKINYWKFFYIFTTSNKDRSYQFFF